MKVQFYTIWYLLKLYLTTFRKSCFYLLRCRAYLRTHEPCTPTPASQISDMIGSWNFRKSNSEAGDDNWWWQQPDRKLVNVLQIKIHSMSAILKLPSLFSCVLACFKEIRKSHWWKSFYFQFILKENWWS